MKQYHDKKNRSIDAKTQKKEEESMKKSRKKRVAAALLAFAIALTGTSLAPLAGVPSEKAPLAARAETGLNMNGNTIQGYAYTNSNFAVYNRTIL